MIAVWVEGDDCSRVGKIGTELDAESLDGVVLGVRCDGAALHLRAEVELRELNLGGMQDCVGVRLDDAADKFLSRLTSPVCEPAKGLKLTLLFALPKFSPHGLSGEGVASDEIRKRSGSFAETSVCEVLGTGRDEALCITDNNVVLKTSRDAVGSW